MVKILILDLKKASERFETLRSQHRCTLLFCAGPLKNCQWARAGFLIYIRVDRFPQVISLHFLQCHPLKTQFTYPWGCACLAPCPTTFSMKKCNVTQTGKPSAFCTIEHSVQVFNHGKKSEHIRMSSTPCDIKTVGGKAMIVRPSSSKWHSSRQHTLELLF